VRVFRETVRSFLVAEQAIPAAESAGKVTTEP